MRTLPIIVLRPRSLLYLASLVLFFTVFDGLIISGIPALRTLAGATGVCLGALWAMSRLPKFQLYDGPQYWLLLFLVSVVTIDFGRYLVTGHFPWVNFLQWFQILVFAIILFDLARDPRALRLFGFAIFVAVLYMTLSAFIAPVSLSGRIGLQGMNLNVQAYFYAIAWLTCVAILLGRWPRFRFQEIIIAVLVLVLLYAQLRTGSRGAILASTAGLATLLPLMARNRNLSAYVSIIPVFIAAVIFYLLMVSDLFVERIGLTLEKGDLGYREVIFRGAFELFKQHPVIGIGPDFVEQLGLMTRGRDTSTHNGYLQVATAYGSVGLILFLAMICSALRNCWQYRQTMLGALLFSLLILSIFFGFSADLTFVRYFWCIVALAAGLPLIGNLPTKLSKLSLRK